MMQNAFEGKPPKDNDDLQLEPLDIAQASTECSNLAAASAIYSKAMAKSKRVAEGNPAFKHGVHEEFCMPLDVSAALIECQGTYMFHLAFLLTILFGVSRQSDNIFCFKQSAAWANDASAADAWERTNADDDASFLN